MQRVSIVGSPGSGKTTTAKAVSVALGIPHLELDSIFHQPDWTGLPTDEFQGRVRTFTDRDAWVIDGNYAAYGIVDLVWNRADTVIWLDLSRRETMRRIVLRTFRRISRRERLWNDNREGWQNLVDPRPENNIILWTWTRHNPLRGDYTRRFEDEQWSELDLIRLRTPSEVGNFVSGLAG